MSILVLQVIIKQWDKSQRTDAHVVQRAEIPDRYPITIPPAFYAFDDKIVIDQHGDDWLGDRVTYSMTEDKKIQCDRFQVCLDSKTIQYAHQPDAKQHVRTIGSVENKWVQCWYDWRYSVYEGGFYYWLYEAVIVNAICMTSLDETVFVHSDPATLFDANTG